mgnify:CR=1 FL=1
MSMNAWMGKGCATAVFLKNFAGLQEIYRSLRNIRDASPFLDT